MSKKRESCKERDVFFDWNGKIYQDKHFFRIMVGDFRQRMTIPQKFVQRLTGKITGTIKLESRAGSSFDVQVINNQGKVSLGFGWEAFVSSHDLNRGDFLVFKYNRRSHLKVLIFDPSGCEKLSSIVMDATHKSQRKEPVGMPSPYHDISMKSSSSANKAWEQQDSSNQGHNVIDISSSSSLPRSSEDATFPKDDQEVQFVPEYILPCGTYLTSMQKQKVKEKVRAIHSEIPIHVCVMTKSNIYGRSRCMNFSRQYADAYLRFEKKELMLQCGGKIWDVRCSKVGKHTRLWKGWKQFASDKNLQLGDICLLELLRNKEYTMNVHIIRSR
ncbi:putative B3 domain-containing protein Os03g0621600 [Panicum virgatum]|uniref:TF-B3 domain-containing protein n=1 Tax=Panicum virgatum TaxID=38727 RepID=A0A8T0MHG9_PANVG|nr:putative B3 domain-containing protein Os03g0621600 [Panicum virgatum]KAG2536567.1 hypothetical protein PVAP13_9NG197000 [Panicum virgatum]